MKSDSLRLPAGTSMTVCGSGIILALEWQGPVGLHIVRLEQSVDWTDEAARDETILNVVGLFRNIVALEKLEDALHTDESSQSHVD